MTTNRLAFRAPKNSKSTGTSTIPVPIRLQPEELKKADDYASNEIRSRASFVRMIFLRGLKDYEQEQAGAK